MRVRMCTIYDDLLMLPSIYFYESSSLYCSQAEPGWTYSCHSTWFTTKSQFGASSRFAVCMTSLRLIQPYAYPAASPKS